jgi:glycosyltransferase involved in cell wall biosynthesis
VSDALQGTALRAPAAPSSAGSAPGPAPRLSVLIPAYDAADTIGEAVESVLAQSPPPFEVIVSDDGSRDDLAGALAPFGEHVRVVRGRNAGLATARNRAAAVAEGELLGLLDADDVWLPGRAAALVEAARQRPDLAVITTDAVVVRDGVLDAQTYYATRAFPVARQDLGILRESFIFGAGAVRADAFHRAGGYRDGARSAEDWDLWLRLLLTGHSAGLIELPLYEYRRRAQSLTRQRLNLALGVLEALRRAERLVDGADQRRMLLRTEQRWREVAARAAGRSRHPDARRLAGEAARGQAATVRARLRFTAAAVLPARLVATFPGPR